MATWVFVQDSPLIGTVLGLAGLLNLLRPGRSGGKPNAGPANDNLEGPWPLVPFPEDTPSTVANDLETTTSIKIRPSLPLDAIRRPRNTPIRKLEASVKCRSCRKGRSAPTVRTIKLTEARNHAI